MMPKILEFYNGLEFYLKPGGKAHHVKMIRLDTGKELSVRELLYGWCCAICYHGMQELENDVVCPNCGAHEVITKNEHSALYRESLKYALALPRDAQEIVLQEIKPPIEPWYQGIPLIDETENPLANHRDPLPEHLKKK